MNPVTDAGMPELRDSYFPGTEALRPDEMRIIALGTGRPFLRMAQANASWLVELGNGDRFILDFGFASFTRFTALEIPITEITAFFASHLHSDHVGDFGAYWVGARTGGRLRPLEFYGPSGNDPELGWSHFVKHQIASYRWDMDGRRGLLPLIGEQVASHEFAWAGRDIVYERNGVQVSSFPAVHNHDGAVSYRLEWNGMSLVYSGDTAPNKFLVQAGQGSDVLIHEAFNTTEQLMQRSGYDLQTARAVGGGYTHSQPRDVGHVFALTRPRMAVAFHFSHDFDTGIEVGEQIRENYDGPLALARDLMVINVRPGATRVRLACASGHAWPNKARHDGFGTAERGEVTPMAAWLRDSRLVFDDDGTAPALQPN